MSDDVIKNIAVNGATLADIEDLKKVTGNMMDVIWNTREAHGLPKRSLDEQAKIPLGPEGFKQHLREAIEAFTYDAYVIMCKDEGYDDDDPEDESESEDDLERSDFMPDYVVEGIALRGTQLICMSDLEIYFGPWDIFDVPYRFEIDAIMEVILRMREEHGLS